MIRPMEIRTEDQRTVLRLNVRKTSLGKYDSKVALKSPNDQNKNALETRRAERTETGRNSPEVAQALAVPAQIQSINVSKIGAKNSLQLKSAVGRTPKNKTPR